MEQTKKMLTMKTRRSLLHHWPTAPHLSCLLLHVIYSLRSEAVTMEQTTKMLTMRQTPMQILVQRSAREGTYDCATCANCTDILNSSNVDEDNAKITHDP